MHLQNDVVGLAALDGKVDRANPHCVSDALAEEHRHSRREDRAFAGERSRVTDCRGALRRLPGQLLRVRAEDRAVDAGRDLATDLDIVGDAGEEAPSAPARALASEWFRPPETTPRWPMRGQQSWCPPIDSVRWVIRLRGRRRRRRGLIGHALGLVCHGLSLVPHALAAATASGRWLARFCRSEPFGDCFVVLREVSERLGAFA